MAVEPSKHVLNNPEKIKLCRSIISIARLLLSYKRVVTRPSISPASKNHPEQARIVMMIVPKRLPKKKDPAEHSGCYKVADLIDICKKSAMKRWW
jgi:hypothetical protein